MMHKKHTRRLVLTLLSVLLAVSGCSEDFAPEHLLEKTRILAVVADPVEPGFGDDVSLQPMLHIPQGGKVVSESWTFCPVTIGSNFGFACVAEECVTELTGPVSPLGSVSAKPGPLLVDCFTKVLANIESPAGKEEAEESTPPDSEKIPEIIETVFRYTVVVEEEQADGSVTTVERKALTRINLHFEDPPVNRNPEFESITIDGVELNLSGGDTGITLKRAEDLVENCEQSSCEIKIQKFSIVLKVKESSLDTYFNEAYDIDEIEETDVFWYVTAGRLEQEEENNLEIEGVWSFAKLNEEQQEALEDGSLEAWLYAVLRDGEGGQASYGPFIFLVEP